MENTIKTSITLFYKDCEINLLYVEEEGMEDVMWMASCGGQNWNSHNYTKNFYASTKPKNQETKAKYDKILKFVEEEDLDSIIEDSILNDDKAKGNRFNIQDYL
jgi:uncharacterized protein YneR